MTIEVRVDETAGRPVVRKSAMGAAGDALALEADRLVAAAHPGVVEVVASGPIDGGWELVLLHAGRPLCAGPPLSVHEVAQVGVSVATTLADLHALGLVHGRVDSSHVLVGSNGRAILCGLGPGTADPPADPSDDVEALGTLLTDLLGDANELDPIPDRRWGLRRPKDDWERRVLLSLADLACADVATRRPSARRLAADLATAVVPKGVAPAAPVTAPSERMGSTADPLDRLRTSATSPAGSRSLRAVLCAGVGVILMAMALVRTGISDGPSGPTAPPPPTSASAPAEDLVATNDVPAPSTEVQVTGRVLTVGGRHFEVGEPGDLVVVGDWDCNGEATPALLRPASSEVFVFPRWGRGEAVEVGPVRRVEGARSLEATDTADGCSGLTVRTYGGASVEIVSAGAS